MDMPRVTTDELENDYERVREMALHGPVAVGDGVVLMSRTLYEAMTRDERVACHPADLPDDMIAAIDDLGEALEAEQAVGQTAERRAS